MLATAAELAELLGITIEADSDDETRAERILTSVSADIVLACTLVGIVTTTTTLQRRRVIGTELTLPLGPVTAITSVEVDGEAVEDYTIELDTLVRTDGWGSTVEVVYTHGLAAVPEDVKSVCLDAAARKWDNPSGAQQESVDGYSAKHDPDALTKDELQRLIGYRYIY